MDSLDQSAKTTSTESQILITPSIFYKKSSDPNIGNSKYSSLSLDFTFLHRSIPCSYTLVSFFIDSVYLATNHVMPLALHGL
jgi:hypothetical protein